MKILTMFFRPPENIQKYRGDEFQSAVGIIVLHRNVQYRCFAACYSAAVCRQYLLYLRILTALNHRRNIVQYFTLYRADFLFCISIVLTNSTHRLYTLEILAISYAMTCNSIHSIAKTH